MRGRWGLGQLLGFAAIAVLAPVLPVSAARAAPPDGARGDLLEAVPQAPSLALPGAAEALHLTYLSVQSDGALALTTGALYLPPGSPPAGGWPIVAWAHGTTGLGDDCAPTVQGRLPDTTDYLESWLQQGYAIAATDYVGLGTPGVHPYLDGWTEARNVIDSVRAARVARPSALSDRWVVLGQSQGGQAALFTARLAPDEAPELDFRGAVATAPANHVTNQISLLANPFLPLPDVLGSGSSLYLAYILAGLQVSRPGVDVNGYLTPVGRAAVDDAEQLCFRDMYVRMAGVTAASMLSRPVDRRLRTALDGVSTIPTDGYRCPFFVAAGVLDTTVTIVNSTMLLLELLASVEPVDFALYPVGDHGTTMWWALPDTQPWVAARFATPCS